MRDSMRSPAVLAAALLLGATGMTCRAPAPPPERSPDPVPMPYDPRPHHLPALPVEPQVPPTALPPPVPALPVFEELPPRAGAAGSTRGTIACGAGRCFAPREVCIWVYQSSAWGCLPAADVPATEYIRFACDDSSDCPNGNTCCHTLSREPGRSACVALEECAARICDGGDGAPCPAGQSCKNGVCLPDRPPPASCDGKKACPADKPFCFWQDTEGQCVAEEKGKELLGAQEQEGGASLRRCTRPADCAPGFRCCESSADGAWTSSCSLQCYEGQRADYCDTDADCAVNTDGSTACRKARSIGEAAMPPWSKRCSPPAEPGAGTLRPQPAGPVADKPAAPQARPAVAKPPPPPKK